VLLSSELDFGTGGSNQSNNAFVGLGVVTAAEAKTTQILATSGHATAFYCFQLAAAAADRVFTLRKGTSTANGAPTFADTTLTCTIASGKQSGQTTGASVAFSAGDSFDIKLPGTVEGKT